MSFMGYDGSKEHARYKERAGFFCGVEIFEEGFRAMDNVPSEEVVHRLRPAATLR